MSRGWLRLALWGLLLAVLAGVGVAAVYQQRARDAGAAAAALPRLGRVPDFALTNRDGTTVRLADLAGAPWIADFVFTRCGSSCPLLSAQMARLDRALPAAAAGTAQPASQAKPGIRLVSFSVDPAYDTAPVLAAYARSFGASPRWLFLTGPPRTMQSLSRDGFKLALEPGGGGGMAAPAEAVLHSTRFVLVDAGGIVRGYYQGLDAPSLARLTADAQALAATAPPPA